MPDDTAVSCEKNGWTDRCSVWVVDSGGLKEAQVQSYLLDGANVPSLEGTLAPPGTHCSWASDIGLYQSQKADKLNQNLLGFFDISKQHVSG